MKLTGRCVEWFANPDFNKEVATIELKLPTQTDLENLKVGDKVLVEVEIKELGQGRLKGTFKDIYDTDFVMSEIKVIEKEYFKIPDTQKKELESAVNNIKLEYCRNLSDDSLYDNNLKILVDFVQSHID